MGWSINLIENTVQISQECASDLFNAGKEIGIWYDEEEVSKDGNLRFNPDHMEHMDYLCNDEITAVLEQHKVNGEVTFCSYEGDNAGSYWGYRFKDGKLTRLKRKKNDLQWK